MILFTSIIFGSILIPLEFVLAAKSAESAQSNLNLNDSAENMIRFENITNKIGNVTIVNASALPLTIPFYGGPPERDTENSTNLAVTRSFVNGSNNLSSLAVLPSSGSQNIRFDGISEATGNCRGCPPDVQVAVGPNGYVMEMVNFAVSIGKHPNCNPLCSTGLSFHLASFFGLPSGTTDNISDPRVIYDNLSGRWFASMLDATIDSVFLATSITSDPTQGWFIISLPFSNCPDRPNIGVNDNIVAISATVQTNHCGDDGILQGMEFLLIHKLDLISGAGPPRTLAFPANPDMRTLYDLYPIQAYSNNSPLYMVGIDLPSGNEALLRVVSFALDITDPDFSRGVNIAFASIDYPKISADASQPGTNLYLETGEFRIQDAAWRNGLMWVAFNASCRPSPPDTYCIRLIQLREVQTTPDTLTVDVNQDFDFGPNYFYPSLEIDIAGNMMLIFGVSSSDIYPSLMVSGQSAGDPINSARGPFVLKSGSASYAGSPERQCQSVCRYGDYFGSALDPNNPMLIWLAGQYVKPDSSYSTYIAQVASPIS